MPPPIDALAAALDALAKGVAPVPCIDGTKVPAVRWKEWQTVLPPESLVCEWFAVRRNIAIVTTGMVLFDCDDPAQADRVVAHCGDTPHRVRTPRGGLHLGYRLPAGVALTNRVKVRGLGLDIRTNGGIEVIPPSWTEHGSYQWLGDGLRPLAEIPFGNVEWTREPKPVPRPPQPGGLPPAAGRIAYPEAYCLKVRSVQGQNGSRALVRVVCVLRDAGRTPDQAFEYLWVVWNPACADPPWSEREIRHAIARHYGRL